MADEIPTEQSPLLPTALDPMRKEEEGISSYEAAYHIVCVIAGTGLLQIPFAMSQGGWSVIGFLIASAAVNIYTGQKIIKCLHHNGNELDGYPAIGEAAFGATGKYTVSLFYNMAMCGSVCLYLILAAMNLTAMVGILDQKQWIMALAFSLLIPLLAVRTLKEVGFVSFLGALASVVVVIIVAIVGVIDYPNYVDKIEHKLFDYRYFGPVLGTLCFSFGGNYVYPEVYRSMGPSRGKFPLAMTYAVCFISLLYLVTGIVGYQTYGNKAISPILLNLPNGFAKTFSLGIITFHVIFACPLLLTTITSDVEREFGVQTGAGRSLTRIILVTCLTCLSIWLPYFSDMMNLVGAVSNTMLIFVLPIICDYVLDKQAGIEKEWPEIILGVSIVLIGLVGGGFGTYDALLALWRDIQSDLIQ